MSNLIVLIYSDAEEEKKKILTVKLGFVHDIMRFMIVLTWFDLCCTKIYTVD